MNKEEALRLAREQKIDVSMVVREEWEMKILRVLAESEIGKKVFFKGGTALRLGYGSPRFSEDLDFTVMANQKITQAEMDNFASLVVKSYPGLKVSDSQIKYYTALVEFKISDPVLPNNFSLKIEISTRASRFKYQVALLTSPTTNLQVLLSIETLESLLEDKMEALADRKKARDIFDIWFICQRLKQEVPLDLPKVDKRQIKQELNRFLPVNFAPVIKEIEDQYGN